MENFLKHFTLLIVEDDITCNKELVTLLDKRCGELYSAINVQEGLSLYEEKDPDIILTSNSFHDIDGLQMEELLRNVGAKKPIVVTSTLDEHDALVRSITLGVKNYLFKPIRDIELIHILERIAESLYTKKQYTQTYVLLEQYKNAVDYSSIVTKTDLKGIITYVNKNFVEISGYSEEELIGKSHNIVRHPEMSSLVFHDLWKTIKAKKTWQGVIKNRAKDGSAYVVSATIMPILDDDGEILEYIAIRQDVTELLTQKETIVRQTTDTLTQLSNRVKLLEAIDESIYPNLALMNINNFREINDLYSFEVGDKLLVEVAHTIGEFIKFTSCQLFKLPADEFAVLMDTAYDVYSFEEMVFNLVSDFKSRAIQIDEHSINVSITVGVSHSKRNVLSNADIALQDARKLKKHYLIYNEDSREKTKENLQWHNTIKNAIKDNRIVPYYQPIYNLQTDKIEKYEALVRLIDTDGTVISPFFFLDIAKKYRLYEYNTNNDRTNF